MSLIHKFPLEKACKYEYDNTFLTIYPSKVESLAIISIRSQTGLAHFWPGLTTL